MRSGARLDRTKRKRAAVADKLHEPYWQAWLRWHLYRRHKRDQSRRAHYEMFWAFKKALRDGAGSAFLDCGANVGDVTGLALESGMIVHAFEPNRMAADRLTERFGGHERLTIHRVAVGASARRAVLSQSVEGGLAYTVSSSLFFGKPDDFERGEEVEVIDLFAFMKTLSDPIGVVKLDVEGAEFEILERFVSERPDVGAVLAETHERMLPEFGPRLAEIQRVISEKGIENIHLGWP